MAQSPVYLNVEINVLAAQGQSSDSVLKIMDLYNESKEEEIMQAYKGIHVILYK